MNSSAHWRTRRQRLSLVGEQCPHCQAMLFPPRDVCPECGGSAQEPYAYDGQGTVYSYSEVYAPAEGFARYAPYIVALVQLDEGPLLTAQLTDVDAEDVYVGMPVEMVTRKLREDGPDGLITYNYKFRPALVPAGA